MTATTSTNPFLSFRESVELRVAAATVRGGLINSGASWLVHPWVPEFRATLARKFVTGQTYPCPHLVQGLASVMVCAYREGPMEVQCQDCAMADPPQFTLVDSQTCVRCSTYARTIYTAAIPFGPVLVSLTLCKPCSTELRSPVNPGAMA